jgi:hypothetical protein
MARLQPAPHPRYRPAGGPRHLADYYVYDQDGDSLVDLELQWVDSGGAVNVSAARWDIDVYLHRQ